MNLAVGIPAASVPTASVPQSAAKTSTAIGDQWQRASARAMHEPDAQPKVPQAAAEKATQRASAEKSTDAPTARDTRTRKPKASSGKAEADRRRVAHPPLVAGTNVATAAPYLLQVAAAATSQTGPMPATKGSRAGAEGVTRAAGNNGRAATNAGAANSRAPLATMSAQIKDSGQVPTPGSTLPKTDPKTLHADATHPGTEGAARVLQTEAAHATAAHASVHADNLASTATPSAMGAANLPARTQSDRDADHAAGAQASDPAPLAVRVASGRLQKTAAGLTPTQVGATNYSAGVTGAASGVQLVSPTAVAVSHAAGETADGSNQNVLHQLGGQIHELYQGGGGQTTVQLSPPALGNVQIHVQVQPNHSVTVSFVASQPQTAQLIQAGIPLLTQALQQNHMQLAQAQVSLANTAGGAGTSSGQQGSAAFQQPGGGANGDWRSGSLAPQGRDAVIEPAPADTQGVMAYA